MSSDKTGSFSEILETFDNLEQSLIDYEDSIENNAEDSSLIHIIFRYAHNLKSSLAMVQKHYSSELIHVVESNFDLIRSGKAGSSIELVDRCLDAIDLIRSNLDKEESEKELSDMKKTIEGILETKEEKNSEIPDDLSEEEQKLLDEALANSQNIFKAEKVVNSSISLDDYHNLFLYQDIEEIGTLIAVRPSYEQINKKYSETVLQVFFATSKTEEELFFHIFDPIRLIIQPDSPHTIGSESVNTQEAASSDKPDSKIQSEQSEGVKPAVAEGIQQQKKKENLDILIVEDDFVTRHLEASLLKSYGDFEIAVNGIEAIHAFESRLKNKNPYELVILDIRIPELSGHEVLDRIRKLEEQYQRYGLDQTKIIVVSVLDDYDTIMQSFKQQSDAYLVKPITREKIETQLTKLGLI